MRKVGILLFIIGAAAIGYGFLILAAASGTKFFVIWFLIGAFFLWAGYMTNGNHWHAVLSAVRIALAVLVTAAVVIVAAGTACIMTHFHDRAPDGLDEIIVIGAQVRESGPSRVLRSRLNAAAAYLAENPDTVCIVSGGQGPNEPCTEAEAMKEYLVRKGIPENQILEEDKSTTTVENLEFSSRFLNRKEDSVGIVTNNFHMFRSLKLAKKNGYQNCRGIAAGSTPLYLPNNILRECLGIVKEVMWGNF